MWSPIQTVGRVLDDDFESREEAPISRCKHAMCTTPDGHIYLFGGRCGNRPLKDLWRLDPGQNTWEEVKCWGDHPPCLQEHTMTPWNDKLFVFGGEIGFSSCSETPLWILDLGTCIWRKGCSGPSRSKPGLSGMPPTGRRAHTAVLYKSAIHVYGGYQDLKGSSSELWKFNLDLEQWHLVSDSQRYSHQPSPRYSHSAVVHDACMWIYGGMTDLQEKGDFWKWTFELEQWTKVKSNKGPGPLHAHSATKAFDYMFLFGGEKDGVLRQDLWRYHFKSNTWEKIVVDGLMPNPRCRHIAVANPSLEIAAREKEEENENFLTIIRPQSKSSYALSKSNSTKPSNLVPAKSISMCFGHHNETPLHRSDPSKLKSSRAKVHPMSLTICSKASLSVSDDEDLDEEENEIRLKPKLNRRKSLKERISSRIVRSISSSSSYNILHNQANNNCNSTSSDASKKTDISNSSSMESGKLRILNTCDEDLEEDDPVQCSIPFSSPLQKSHSSDPVLESEYDLVIRRRVEGPPTWGQKIRPRSEVLEGLVHLESLLENSEFDCNVGSGVTENLKRRSVSESMSYYSLCFPSPPFDRRIKSPETESSTRIGSSIGDANESSNIMDSNENVSESSGFPQVPKASNNEKLVQQSSESFENQRYTCHGYMENCDPTDSNCESCPNCTKEPNSQLIHFDEHFYKTLHSLPAEGSGEISGYNSSATLETPSTESQDLPHSMSHSSGYHSANEENFLGNELPREMYNPFHLHLSGNSHNQIVGTNLVTRRFLRLPQTNLTNTNPNNLEMKQINPMPLNHPSENPTNTRLGKEILRNRARDRAALRNSGLRNSFNENKLWQQINVIKEVVVPSSPAARQWIYSPGRSKIQQYRWQLCMYVFGGQEQGSSGSIYKQPISVWKFYI